MRRNNKALYELIMRNVSKQVKRVLNENINSDNLSKKIDDLLLGYNKLERTYEPKRYPGNKKFLHRIANYEIYTDFSEEDPELLEISRIDEQGVYNSLLYDILEKITNTNPEYFILKFLKGYTLKIIACWDAMMSRRKTSTKTIKFRNCLSDDEFVMQLKDKFDEVAELVK